MQLASQFCCKKSCTNFAKYNTLRNEHVSQFFLARRNRFEKKKSVLLRTTLSATETLPGKFISGYATLGNVSYNLYRSKTAYCLV